MSKPVSPARTGEAGDPVASAFSGLGESGEDFWRGMSFVHVGRLKELGLMSARGMGAKQQEEQTHQREAKISKRGAKKSSRKQPKAPGRQLS